MISFASAFFQILVRQNQRWKRFIACSSIQDLHVQGEYAFDGGSRRRRDGSRHQLHPLCLCSCAGCGFSVLPALMRAIMSIYLSSGSTRTSVIMPIIEAVQPAASPYVSGLATSSSMIIIMSCG